MDLDCYGELLDQVRAFFIFSFIAQFLEIFLQILKGWYNNHKRQKVAHIQKDYIWEKIDKQIEDQFHLLPYQTTPEIDGVYSDYMDIVLLVGFLSCFSTIFPIGKLIQLL